MIDSALNPGGKQLTCGSELARDGGLTFNIYIGCYDAIASKLAPTGFVC